MPRLLIPVLALVGLLALTPAPAAAQQPPPVTATDVASSVQRFYDQLTTLRARFFLTQVQHMTNHTLRGGGELLVLKPGKMRFNFDDDPHSDERGQVLVSDGDHIQQFTPGDDGEPGTVIETSIHDSDLTGPLSFLLGTGRLDAQFTFRLLDARTQGFTTAGGYVLEMTPITPSAHYERVLLYVRAPTRNLRDGSVVDRVLIVNHTGDRTRYDFTYGHGSMSAANVRAEDFRYTAPAGTQRITPGNR